MSLPQAVAHGRSLAAGRLARYLAVAWGTLLAV